MPLGCRRELSFEGTRRELIPIGPIEGQIDGRRVGTRDGRKDGPQLGIIQYTFSIKYKNSEILKNLE